MVGRYYWNTGRGDPSLGARAIPGLLPLLDLVDDIVRNLEDDGEDLDIDEKSVGDNDKGDPDNDDDV